MLGLPLEDPMRLATASLAATALFACAAPQAMSPSASGTLPLPAKNSALERHQAELLLCQAMEAMPGLPALKELALSWQVTPGGQAERVVIERPSPVHPLFAACVQAVVAGWSFPPPFGGAAPVSHVFDLAALAERAAGADHAASPASGFAAAMDGQARFDRLDRMLAAFERVRLHTQADDAALADFILRKENGLYALERQYLAMARDPGLLPAFQQGALVKIGEAFAEVAASINEIPPPEAVLADAPKREAFYHRLLAAALPREEMALFYYEIVIRRALAKPQITEWLFEALSRYHRFRPDSALVRSVLRPPSDQAAQTERTRVLVQEIKPQDVDARASTAVTEQLAFVLGQEHQARLSVLQLRDVQNLLAFASQKQQLGQGDATDLAEATSALGVERMVTGTLRRVGADLALTLEWVQLAPLEVKNRAQAQAASEAELLRGMSGLCQRLVTGQP
jgi:hypothetical protein